MKIRITEEDKRILSKPKVKDLRLIRFCPKCGLMISLLVKKDEQGLKSLVKK